MTETFDLLTSIDCSTLFFWIVSCVYPLVSIKLLLAVKHTCGFGPFTDDTLTLTFTVTADLSFTPQIQEVRTKTAGPQSHLGEQWKTTGSRPRWPFLSFSVLSTELILFSQTFWGKWQNLLSDRQTCALTCVGLEAWRRGRLEFKVSSPCWWSSDVGLRPSVCYLCLGKNKLNQKATISIFSIRALAITRTLAVWYWKRQSVWSLHVPPMFHIRCFPAIEKVRDLTRSTGLWEI